MESNPGHGKDYVRELVGNKADSSYIEGWIAGYTHDCGSQEECDRLFNELNNYLKQILK